VTTEHRKAPRRDVEGIDRVGPWGDVKYHHRLVCGHIEVRVRATRAPSLACVGCLKASVKAVELAAFTDRPPVIYDFDENLTRQEVEIAKIKANIAKTLKVSGDAVDVIAVDEAGHLRVQSAVVFLSADDIRRLTQQG